MSDKVYVVTSGDYSDYRIDCVFRTKGEADAWVSARWEPSRYDVNEWKFDTVNPEGLSGFTVLLHMEDGSVEAGGENDCHEGPAIVSVSWTKKPLSWSKPEHASLWVRCLAKDRNHAIKIASEYRRMILASPLYDEWINSPDPSAIDLKWHHNEKSDEE
jgi:hypothetical protein